MLMTITASMRLFFFAFCFISFSLFSQIRLDPSYQYLKSGKKISYSKALKLLQTGDFVADISDVDQTVNIMEPMTMEIGDSFRFETVIDINGNPITAESIAGKILVVNYWFIGCKPCVMEMPELNEVVDKYKEQEVVFLAYANDIAPKVSSFLAKRAFDYTVIPGQMTATLSKGVTTFPTHIFVDANGIIVDKFSGYSEGVGDSIAAQIDKMLK